MADFDGQLTKGAVFQGTFDSDRAGNFVRSRSSGLNAWVNRVYDAVEGGTVTWTTIGSSDIATGVYYPGPGTYDPTQSGSDTSDATIESIVDAAVV